MGTSSTILAAVLLLDCLVYAGLCILSALRRTRSKPMSNIEGTLLPTREELRGQVFAGNMVEYLKRHDVARWRSWAGGRAGCAIAEERDKITHREIFPN